MSPEQVTQIAVGALLTLAGAIQAYLLLEIAKLRKSKHLHANVLQRHIGRFARISQILKIEWDDVEADLMKG